MNSLRSLALVAIATLLVAATGAGDRLPVRRAPSGESASTASALPRFALFGWVSPPRESTTAARYAELADVGFDVTVLAWEDAGLESENHARLDMTRPLGVRNLLLDNRLNEVHENQPVTLSIADSVAASYRDDPAFLGYYLGDEPAESEFPRLAEFFRVLRARDPAHPGWNNLRGRGQFASHDAWLAYTRDYVTQVGPAVLSNDQYDFLVSGDRGLLVENVAGLASVARERGLPFWGVVLLVGHGSFRQVTEGELRWQVAQWVSYGARGIGYFTYWTPAPDTVWNWQPAMIAWGGARTAHYDSVQALNARLRPIGETLAGLTWLSTEHTGFLPAYGTPFAPDSLLAAVAGRAAIGSFADSSGAPYLFVANSDSAASRSIALELVGERRVERMTDAGAWRDAPSVPTSRGRRVTLQLAAGDFALLRVGGACDMLRSGRCEATLDASPNPSRGAVRFAATGAHGRTRLTIVDAGGRRLWSRELGGVAPVITWDGTRDDGRRVPPGLYFARLEDARGAIVRRVAWLGAR